MKYISNQNFNGQTVYIETDSLKEDLELSSKIVVVNGENHSINFNFNELSKDEESSNLVLEASCESLNLAAHTEINDLEKLVIECINLVSMDELPEQNDFIRSLMDKATNKLFEDFRKENLVENIEYNGIVGLVRDNDRNLFGTIDGFLYSKENLELKGNSDLIKDLSDEKNVIIEVCLGNVAYRISGNVKDNENIDIKNIEKIPVEEIPETFLNMKTLDDFFGDKDEYMVYRRGLILDQQDQASLSLDIDDLDF